ncbi:MAG TPA: sigma-70 family RNA polymerase sigma factor [Gemmataceae bacterium]
MAVPSQVLQHIRRLVQPSPADLDSDAALLGRFVRDHDQTAFSALVARHGPMVLRLCRRVLGDAHAAEDACQAAFLVLARKADRIRHADTLAAWLHGVAYRLALKARAVQVRRQQAETRSLQIHPGSTPRDPLAEVSGRELLAILDVELQRLPARYRLPLILCCLEGRSQPEAARLLGWTPGSVKGRLERGRAKLHQRLLRRGLTLSAALLALEAERGSATARLSAELTASLMRAASTITSSVAMKTKIVLILVLMLGAVAGGASWLASGGRQPPVAKKKQGADAPRSPKARTDRYGDPLPPGALARLGTVRFRHAGWMERLAFTSDGTRLAYAGNDGIRLWETTSGRPVRHFGERSDAFAFLDDGKRILAGGENLVVWDIASGKEVKRLPIKGGLRHLQRSPDGKLLAGEGDGGALLLLDAATGAIHKQLDGHEDQLNERPKGAPPRRGQILNVAFSPDGKALASVCVQDKRVFLWDTATGKPRRTLPGHDRPRVAQFSPDGHLLAVGGDDCLIRLWDVATGRELRQFRGHVGGINGLAFSPDGLKLASGGDGSPPNTKSNESADSTVRLWDLKTGKCQPLNGPERWVRAIAFSPDGKLLAAGGSGTSICLFDVATGKRRQRHIGHDGEIFCVALSPDGSTLASGGGDNLIHLWDLKTSQEKARLEGHQHHVSRLAFTPDGSQLLSCSYDGTVRVWDWRREKETRRFAPTDGWLYGFDLAPDGTTLILPTGQLWNVATGKQSGAVPNYRGLQYRLVFSPDGKRVATSGGEAARILDVATGKEICRFTGHEAMKDDRRGGNGIVVDCVAFGPEGRRAASGGAEGMAFIWDAATGKRLRRLQGHENPIIGIAFSPDGRMVATANGSMWNHKEQTVRLWEVATGKERRRFVGHQAQVTSIVFSREGSTLISGSEDGTALVWDAAGVLKPEVAGGTDGEGLWRTLAGADAVAAFEAVCALAARREVAFFSKRLKRVEAPNAAKIGRHLADLDSNEFATRERAENELAQLEELAEPDLRKALTKSVSLEMRRRIEHLLAKLDANPPSAKTLQALRAIEALEHIATPEARQLLRKLADGYPAARPTRAAKAALERLAKRAAAKP